MKTRVLFVILFSSIGLPGGANETALLGKTAPEFTLRTLDGRESHSLSQFKGSVVLIDFWASWCAPCKRSLPKLARMEESVQGVRVLAVNIDDEARNGLEFLRRNNLRLLSLYDKDKSVAARYDVPAMPTAIVIDKKGVVRYVHGGYSESDIQLIQKEIQSLL